MSFPEDSVVQYHIFGSGVEEHLLQYSIMPPLRNCVHISSRCVQFISRPDRTSRCSLAYCAGRARRAGRAFRPHPSAAMTFAAGECVFLPSKMEIVITNKPRTHTAMTNRALLYLVASLEPSKLYCNNMLRQFHGMYCPPSHLTRRLLHVLQPLRTRDFRSRPALSIFGSRQSLR